MELYLSSGWYLINPREIRAVRYFQYCNYLDKEYPPDYNFEKILSDITLKEEYFWKKEVWEDNERVYVELSENEKEEKIAEIKNKTNKIIEIEMYDKTGNDGRKYPNCIKINVNNNNTFDYIYQNLSRKFGLRIRNKEIEKNKIIKLYEKGLSVEEITEILNIKDTLIKKIIEEYKSKKNGI
jgi:uncharacterized protein (DUF433 family)